MHHGVASGQPEVELLALLRLLELKWFYTLVILFSFVLVFLAHLTLSCFFFLPVGYRRQWWRWDG